jgi:hypothetical protein
LGFKILKFFDADPDLGSEIFLTLDPGSRMEKIGSRIGDKHPGSATLLFTEWFTFEHLSTPPPPHMHGTPTPKVNGSQFLFGFFYE